MSTFSYCSLDAPLIYLCLHSLSAFAGWLIPDESEMPALHLGSQQGQSSAKQSLCLSRLSFLMEGKLCLTRCEDSSASATFRDKLLFVFDKPGHSCSLTRPDLWRFSCSDGQPLPSHCLFCLSGPCLLCHCYFISRHILHPGSFDSLLIDVL